MLNYGKVYNLEKMLSDHARPVHYELPLPLPLQANTPVALGQKLYIHAHRARAGRSIDDSTEHFVDAARMGAAG